MPASSRRKGAARPPAGQAGRREFLKKAVALPAALAVASGAAAGAAGAEAPQAPAEQPKLPQVRLGKHSISRLICGSNPFGAGSHLSVFVNEEMRRYYTPQQVLKTLRRCHEVGVNCWQAGPGYLELYRQLTEAGVEMHFLAIAAGDAKEIDACRQGGCIGIAHHGEVTDSLFKQGKLEQVSEYLKRVRDAGLLVGVSTHMPDVVDAIESKGWDLDYYMTCVYERHRGTAELKKLLGQAPIPVGEVYLPNDPPRMFKAMRATARPCLAFKILAAGRLSERRDWVEEAFRQTFASIKPTDAAIVGIYDRYSDQPADCAELVRRYGSAGGAAKGAAG